MELDFSALAHASPLGFVLVFLGGIATSVGPCNVAMIPLVMAFVGGRRAVSRQTSFWLSAAFALGLAVTLTILGVAAALVGLLTGGWVRGWYYLVAAVCIVMGLQWMQLIHLPLPDWAGEARGRIHQQGVLGAFLFGLASGIAASGCATPALAAILTLVMSTGEMAYGAALLFVYGLGRGVPIVILGTFAGALALLPRLQRWTAWLERASGVVLVAVGLYFLWIA